MTTDSGDWKAMVTACQNGDDETVRYYLDQGIDPDFQHPEMGTTALHEAALYGHLPVVELLVGRGASLSIEREFGGGTPLEVAQQAGHRNIADWLAGKQPPKKGKRWFRRG
ncbi:MAG: ankyrin repeat domain-containing protein [Bacteroidota bacterium]